jgi:hypothetical protein
MSYKVNKLPPALRNEISSWNLPRPILLEVYNRLYNDLASDPNGLLQEQVVPFANMFTYPFTIPQRPPFDRSYAFIFFVRRDAAAETLTIAAGRFINGFESN